MSCKGNTYHFLDLENQALGYNSSLGAWVAVNEEQADV
jgi:hypothetical protein